MLEDIREWTRPLASWKASKGCCSRRPFHLQTSYLEGVAAAHTRASSLEKEVPVKIEALVTEMQEVAKEELTKHEAPVEYVIESARKNEEKEQP